MEKSGKPTNNGRQTGHYDDPHFDRETALGNKPKDHPQKATLTDKGSHMAIRDDDRNLSEKEA